MERVRDVFVLPFHRIRRRIIFHALVLSPLRANDVRVTRGETQGLVLAAKEDESSSDASSAASSSSRVYEESIYRRDRVQRCFLQRQTYPVRGQRFATRRGRQVDRAGRRRPGGERRGGDVFRQRAVQLLLIVLWTKIKQLFWSLLFWGNYLKLGTQLCHIIVRHNNFFYCFRDDEKRRRRSVFQSGGGRRVLFIVGLLVGRVSAAFPPSLGRVSRPSVSASVSIRRRFSSGK